MYRHFDTKVSRQELVGISCNLADHLSREKIRNLVLVDRGARPAYLGLIKAWNKYHQDEEKPDIYFLNPGISKSFLYHYAEPTDQEYIEIADKFSKEYDKLCENRNKRTMIFDNCVHTGETVDSINELFKELGFEDFSFGFVSPKYRCKHDVEGFTALNHVSHSNCWPFSHERIVRKDMDSVTSIRETNPEKRASSIEIRKEIKDIFDEPENYSYYKMRKKS